MFPRTAMLLLVVLAVLANPSRAAEQRTYQDRLHVRATDTVDLGQLVDGWVSFHETEIRGDGGTIHVLVEGSAPLRQGESIEAAEQRAVLDALAKVFQTNRVNTAHLVESTTTHNFSVAQDAIQIEFDYVLEPGLTILDRRIDGDSVFVTLRAPIQTPIHGQENSDIPASWTDIYDRMGESTRSLFDYRSKSARTMGLWMNKMGGAIRDLMP